MKKRFPFRDTVSDEPDAEYARKHRDIIAQFGRYPHRNEALGGESTPEEIEDLKMAERFGQ